MKVLLHPKQKSFAATNTTVGANENFRVKIADPKILVTWQFISGQLISDNLSLSIYPRTFYLCQFISDNLSLTVYLRQFISDNLSPDNFSRDSLSPGNLSQVNLSPTIYLRQFISDNLSPDNLSQDNLSPVNLSPVFLSRTIYPQSIYHNLSAFLNFNQFFAIVVLSISQKVFLGKN
jgi:hypothetical protein